MYGIIKNAILLANLYPLFYYETKRIRIWIWDVSLLWLWGCAGAVWWYLPLSWVWEHLEKLKSENWKWKVKLKTYTNKYKRKIPQNLLSYTEFLFSPVTLPEHRRGRRSQIKRESLGKSGENQKKTILNLVVRQEKCIFASDIRHKKCIFASEIHRIHVNILRD